VLSTVKASLVALPALTVKELDVIGSRLSEIANRVTLPVVLSVRSVKATKPFDVILRTVPRSCPVLASSVTYVSGE
jgi:hypothetical protein